MLEYAGPVPARPGPSRRAAAYGQAAAAGRQ